jgi:hypothetical protein
LKVALSALLVISRSRQHAEIADGKLPRRDKPQ